MDHESPYGGPPFSDLSPPADLPGWTDLPTVLDVLPDGREALVVGDVRDLADFSHLQGDNPFSFQGTCGLVSCEDVLRRFGADVTEGGVVGYAIGSGLCNVSDDPLSSGGTTVADQARILSDFGVPAHVDVGRSLEDLADDIERGSGVIVAANAGVLWDAPNHYDFGQPNHSVVVTGVARDPGSGVVSGFFINDSGTGEAGRFVDADAMSRAWVDAGGSAVVTDVVRIPEART